MNDEIERDEPLAGAVRALQRPVDIIPGLALRARARGRRNQVRRFAGSGVVLIAGVAALALVLRTPGTRVTFAISAPAVQSVALVGDFTDWRADRVKLRRDASGEWHTTLRLPPGRYRFAYVVDRAEWRADSHAALAPDDFGRPTSVLTVAEN